MSIKARCECLSAEKDVRWYMYHQTEALEMMLK